jgi:8-oxo-dGTP diphosphatase
MDIVKKYVVGLAFSSDKTQVAMIKKNRPEPQKGKLNGIGGKIEDGELAQTAMEREFQEETGLFIEDWDLFCTRVYTKDGILNSIIYYFRHWDVDLNQIKSMTDEDVYILYVNQIFDICLDKIVYNMPWVVLMALTDPHHNEIKIESFDDMI